MSDQNNLYRGYHCPAELIAHAVRLNLWFALSYRDSPPGVR